MRRSLAWLLMLFLAVGFGGAQEKDKEDGDDTPEEKVEGKAALAIDNGGHVGVIGGMVFTPDGRTLITVGHDHTIQEYDAESGERLRVIRPPSGQTVGERFNGVALLGGLGKADAGKVLAIIGNGIQDSSGGGVRHQKLFLYHCETGQIVGAISGGLKVGAEGLEALACTPRRAWTATGSGENVLVHKNLGELLSDPKAAARNPNLTLKVKGKRVRSLAFSPDGKTLTATTADQGGRVLTWSVSKTEGPKLLEDRPVENPAFGLAWSPNGKQFVTTHRAKSKNPPLRLWSAQGKPEKTFTRQQLSSRLKGAGAVYLHQPVLRNEREVILSVTWKDEGSTSHQLVLAFDLKTEKGRELLYQGGLTTPHPGADVALIPLALSPDRKLLAVAAEPRGSRIAWIDLTGKEKPRFSGDDHGLRSPILWSKDGTTLAWRTRSEKMRSSLNLKTLTTRPVSGKSEDFTGALHELKEGRKAKNVWKVERLGEKGKLYHLKISHGGKEAAKGPKNLVRLDRFTLSPGSKPWLAWTRNRNLYISDPATGKVRQTLRPFKTRFLALAPSPDGRFLAAASSRELIYIYRITGSERYLNPLLTIYTRDQDWIVWTPQGHYAATPGGERLVGWTTNNGTSKPATFHPASRFRKLLYRPELIPLVLEKGNVKAALAALPPPKKEATKGRSADVKVDDLLPPTIEIISLDRTKLPVVTLKVKAKGTSQPVTSLRLMLNGRPLPEEKYQVDFGEKGKPEHEQTWTLEVTEGKTELSVLARSADSLAVSETKEIPFKKPPASRLFALCVGVNHYRQAKLNLKAACNDASGIAAALKKNCAREPLFASAVVAEPLLDAKATRQGVLAALKDIRSYRDSDGKTIKPTDLMVLFFAGHGVKEGQEFYLLTHDADVKDFKGSCISGSELRKALSAFPCQVLLLLDACHSGSIGGALSAYRPATDEATRALTDEEVGVVVMAAAMDHEPALENGKNGYFAAALIEGIARAQGVPCNFRDKHVYVHHLFSYAFDRVKDQSADKQHPSLNLPSTVESFALVP
jgi:WD40 repeat protein